MVLGQEAAPAPRQRTEASGLIIKLFHLFAHGDGSGRYRYGNKYLCSSRFGGGDEGGKIDFRSVIKRILDYLVAIFLSILRNNLGYFCTPIGLLRPECDRGWFLAAESV